MLVNARDDFWKNLRISPLHKLRHRPRPQAIYGAIEHVTAMLSPVIWMSRSMPIYKKLYHNGTRLSGLPDATMRCILSKLGDVSVLKRHVGLKLQHALTLQLSVTAVSKFDRPLNRPRRV